MNTFIQPEAHPVVLAGPSTSTSPVSVAALHGLAWLAVANLIGVWLAFLLLVPSANGWTGSWTYGRWMPVHLNLQLYGWLSLPLVAWLIRLYGADRAPYARWARTAVWLWSAGLAIGVISWLSGHSSGKLFLDWTGYSRIFFPLAILFLWAVLAVAFVRNRQASSLKNSPLGKNCHPDKNCHPERSEGPASRSDSRLVLILKSAGLVLLLCIPFAIYAAANPAIYPPVNPDSGGPTAASQLESVLVIVLILFLLPYGLTHRNQRSALWIRTGWAIFIIEAILCLGLGRADVSHHRPTQFLSLGSLLVWVPLMPAYYNAFAWPERTKPYRIAVLCWWALLIPTGWSLFLPGVLDHLKFTDGLVSHSLLAMAGFVTSLLILVLIILLGDEVDPFRARWAFIAWQGGTLLYVLLMIGAGWIEGNDPTFTMVPSATRNWIYVLRLLLGAAMAAASIDWFLRLAGSMYPSLPQRAPAHTPIPQTAVLERA